MAGGRDLGAMRTDVENPRLDLEDGAIESVEAGDAIARVIDEQAWLAELARVLAPGGTLRMRLPASGPLAWIDARNTYRYIVDILRRGDTPDDPLPTGWNRHYGDKDARMLLRDAGFANIHIERAGVGLAEPVQLAGLMTGNFLLGKRDTELRLFPLRRVIEGADAQIPVPGIGTTLLVTARRARAEPENPADDVPANTVAPEIGHE